MKKWLSILLALCMLLSLAACGAAAEPAGSAAAAEAASAEAAAEPETVEEAAPEEVQAPAEEASAEDVAAEEAPAEEAEPRNTITYPIEGDYTLTMLACRRFTAVDALGDGDYSDQYTYPELSARTGINVEFNMLAESTYMEQTNLMISTGEYPDIFANGVGSYDFNLLGAIEDGIVYDMTDHLAEYAPDYYALIQSHPDWAELIAVDGHYITFNSCMKGVQSQGIMVRGDWMDALGLEIPTTTEELRDVLAAMHSEYNTPMTLLVTTDLGDGLHTAFNHEQIGYSMNMVGFQQTAPDSGEVISAIASDGYFEHLTFLRELYADGIINGDFLSISKELGTYESSYYTDVCGAWYDGAETVDNGYNAEDPNWVALPISMPSVNGADIHISAYNEFGTGPSSAIISGGCEIPEIAMEFLNYGYTDEGRILVQLGIEDDTFVVNEDGSYAYTEKLTEYDKGLRTAQWAYLTSSWMQTEQIPEIAYIMYSDTAKAACEKWTEDAMQTDHAMNLPTGLSLNEEESAVVNARLTDVVTYFAEIASRYVIGEIDEAGFRQALADADAMGLGEVTAAYQSAFDRYMESH